MITFAQELKDWCSRYKLGTHEAAKFMGLPVKTIVAIQNGQTVTSRERQLVRDKLSTNPHPSVKAIPVAGAPPWTPK